MQLHRRNGRETNWLNPPLTHTPWLLVNGQYVNADVSNIFFFLSNILIINYLNTYIYLSN